MNEACVRGCIRNRLSTAYRGSVEMLLDGSSRRTSTASCDERTDRFARIRLKWQADRSGFRNPYCGDNRFARDFEYSDRRLEVTVRFNIDLKVTLSIYIKYYFNNILRKKFPKVLDSLINILICRGIKIMLYAHIWKHFLKYSNIF